MSRSFLWLDLLLCKFESKNVPGREKKDGKKLRGKVYQLTAWFHQPNSIAPIYQRLIAERTQGVSLSCAALTGTLFHLKLSTKSLSNLHHPDLFASGTQTLTQQAPYSPLGLTSVLKASPDSRRSLLHVRLISSSFSRVTAEATRCTERKERGKKTQACRAFLVEQTFCRANLYHPSWHV
jgi:hypothetical protein